jgi:hypothetical protein
MEHFILEFHNMQCAYLLTLSNWGHLVKVRLQQPQNILFLKAHTYCLCKPRHIPSIFYVLSLASTTTKHIILKSPSQHLLFVQTQPLHGIFPYYTGDMEKLRAYEFCNLSKLIDVSMKEKN